jgi:hypothetical protein
MSARGHSEEGAMNAPMKSVFDLQMGALQTMTVAMTQMAEFWVRMFQTQMQALGMAQPDRRTHDEIAHGATLTDHYGRREHDIDPERDV